MEVAV